MERSDWEKAEQGRGGCAKSLIFIALLLIGALIGALTLHFVTGAPLNVSDSRLLPESESQGQDPASGQTPAAAGSRRENYGRNIMSSDTVRDIVAQCGDSVVRITTEVTRTSSQSPFFNDPFFRDFFGYPQETQKQTGLGSGFLFRKDGYILTNNHVVEGADKISVYLTSNENPYEAKVIGRAPELDLAVIKIEGDNFPYLTIGDSDQVYVGDWVVAIGNPYGLDHTVTVGVISATGRPLNIEGTMYQNLLQTDAAINPGNSGGPMLNLNGEVIGINTAVNATAQGIGFAIPSSTVLDVLQDLETGVDRVRPWIGITMQPMSQDMIQYFNIEGMESGVIVYSVVEDAPAAKAGIKRGDVLLEVDGQKITDSTQVQSIVASRKVGDIVKIIVYRDGGQVEFMVKLEASQSQ